MAQGKDRKTPTAKSKSKATASKKSANVTAGSAKVDGTSDVDAPIVQSSSVPLGLQQRCLNIFRDVLQSAGEDSELLQQVKTHLYNRDFATAFGKEEYLRVYASRWSPSRALGYLEVFAGIEEYLQSDAEHAEGDEKSPLRVVCLGGGAGAEVMGLAGWLSLRDESGLKVDARFVDIASWNAVVHDLFNGTITPPPISKFASAAVRTANVPLLHKDIYSAHFTQLDVLNEKKIQKVDPFKSADLITLMFTLNELYSTSIPQTQAMLARMTSDTRPGAHLLVVDSPGSYSTVSLNGAEKKYPMQWLLDHTLLSTAPAKRGLPTNPAAWEKVLTDESRWFRLPKGLQYPIELENMRYQIHLYRRSGGSSAVTDRDRPY